MKHRFVHLPLAIAAATFSVSVTASLELAFEIRR